MHATWPPATRRPAARRPRARAPGWRRPRARAPAAPGTAPTAAAPPPPPLWRARTAAAPARIRRSPRPDAAPDACDRRGRCCRRSGPHTDRGVPPARRSCRLLARQCRTQLLDALPRPLPHVLDAGGHARGRLRLGEAFEVAELERGAL